MYLKYIFEKLDGSRTRWRLCPLVWYKLIARHSPQSLAFAHIVLFTRTLGIAMKMNLSKPIMAD